MNVRANKYKNHVIPNIHRIHQHILGRGLEDNKHHEANVSGPMKKVCGGFKIVLKNSRDDSIPQMKILKFREVIAVRLESTDR